MTQASLVVANGGGSSVRAAINSALMALATLNIGPTAPNPTYSGMYWGDTGSGTLWRRKSDNSTWLSMGSLDAALSSQFAALAGSSSQVFSVGTATAGAHAPQMAQIQAQTGTAFTAAGTAPAYTLTPSPAITAYAANQRFNVTFPAAGTIGSNTINVNGLGAIPLKQYASDGTVVSAIVTAGMNSDVQIVGAGTYALLLDPLPASPSSTPGMFSINAGTVASNALTVGYPAQNITFRNATLTSGTSSTIAAPAGSLTIPSGATLGIPSGQQGVIVELALNVSGTVVPAVVNLAGGVDLSETGLISTTAISSGATSAGVVYSAAAQTNVPYRVIGAYYVTEATAGTWAAAPSQAIGAGGEAFSALMALGNGQTFQNFSSSGRAFNTTYYNTTPRPIFISVAGGCNTSVAATITVNGQNIASSSTGSGTSLAQLSAIVPPGGSYAAAFPGSLNYWFELR